MKFHRLGAAALAAALLFAACGDDDSATDTTDTTSETTTTTEAPTTTEQRAGLDQPAAWPDPATVLDTPEAAAEAFVHDALGVPPELGPFMQGDARSGEIEVFSPGEGDNATPVRRGTLLLRQLGPTDGWYVLAAVNDVSTIAQPESTSEVDAGAVTVSGVARGFEGTVVVQARIAGDGDSLLDEQVTQGGSFEEPEPYDVTLDLSGASPGDTVTIVVRGGVGLETDPGDFAAIPVVISGEGS